MTHRDCSSSKYHFGCKFVRRTILPRLEYKIRTRFGIVAFPILTDTQRNFWISIYGTRPDWTNRHHRWLASYSPRRTRHAHWHRLMGIIHRHYSQRGSDHPSVTQHARFNPCPSVLPYFCALLHLQARNHLFAPVSFTASL